MVDTWGVGNPMGYSQGGGMNPWMLGGALGLSALGSFFGGDSNNSAADWARKFQSWDLKMRWPFMQMAQAGVPQLMNLMQPGYNWQNFLDPNKPLKKQSMNNWMGQAYSGGGGGGVGFGGLRKMNFKGGGGAPTFPPAGNLPPGVDGLYGGGGMFNSFSGGSNLPFSGESSNLLRQLMGMSQNFKFDENDPVFVQKKAESEKGINQYLAARGMYNSTPGVGMLGDNLNKLIAGSFDDQYKRKYGGIMDALNAQMRMEDNSFNKLMSMMGLGTGAGGQHVNNMGPLTSSYNMQAGLNADKWGGLSSMPLNMLMLSKLFA